MGMLRLPRASVRPLRQPYVLRKMRGTTTKNTPMDDAKHSNISSSAQRRQTKLGECLNLTHANLTQETRLEGIHAAQMTIRCMVDSGGAVFDEGQDVGLPEVNHLVHVVESSGPQERHALPSAFVDQIVDRLMHRQLRVEDDTKQLAIPSDCVPLADDVGRLLAWIEGDPVLLSPLMEALLARRVTPKDFIVVHACVELLECIQIIGVDYLLVLHTPDELCSIGEEQVPQLGTKDCSLENHVLQSHALGLLPIDQHVPNPLPEP